MCRGPGGTRKELAQKGQLREGSEARGVDGPVVSELQQGQIRQAESGSGLDNNRSLVSFAHFHSYGGLWPQRAYFTMKFGQEEEPQRGGEATCLCTQEKER